MRAEAVVAGERVTRDAFLGGAVEALQPAHGHHRAGLEAVLLAAALPRAFSGLVIDLGAGAGIAGFCAAAGRARGTALLVERDPELAACARAALMLPANRAFASRVRVAEVDIGAPEADRLAAGLPHAGADAVLMNPPFHVGETVSAPRAPGRAAAHVLAGDGLELWFRTAAACLKPGGLLIAIGRAADLPEFLAAAARRFGDIDLLPIRPRPAAPATRLLLRGRAGRRGDTALLPGLVLHAGDGHAFRPEVDRVLRAGEPLGDVHVPWGNERHRRQGSSAGEADVAG